MDSVKTRAVAVLQNKKAEAQRMLNLFEADQQICPDSQLARNCELILIQRKKISECDREIHRLQGAGV